MCNISSCYLQYHQFVNCSESSWCPLMCLDYFEKYPTFFIFCIEKWHRQMQPFDMCVTAVLRSIRTLSLLKNSTLKVEWSWNSAEQSNFFCARWRSPFFLENQIFFPPFFLSISNFVFSWKWNWNSSSELHSPPLYSAGVYNFISHHTFPCPISVWYLVVPINQHVFFSLSAFQWRVLFYRLNSHLN